ncbi:MAG: polyphosphate polymerase domain-containing protein [Lachnospiraceae bacterium]|nr:polyphosphate polymerase domain-containing protein [Lachnospiraceae bacterium]
MSEFKEVFERKEIKYLVDDDQYKELMPVLEKFAAVDEYGLSKINNIYYDTPDFRLIRASLDKPVYKEKLRLRTYGETGDDTNSFIEIKKKYKGIVYKRRISGKYADTYEYLAGHGCIPDHSQVGKEIESFVRMYEGLRPAMIIRYDRIAMAGISDRDLRVTFDTNIRWDTRKMDLRTSDRGKQILKPWEKLMELKVVNAIPLELSRKLSELNVFPVSFSKYGRGYADLTGFNETENGINAKVISYTEYRNNMNDKGVIAYV